MGDAALEALWKRVTDDWADDAAHGSFLRHCQETEQLAEAAARYGGMKGDRERGPSALKKLDAVALLATSSMLATRTEAERPLPRWFVVAALLFFGAMAAYAVLRVARG
jgi:hypothetical protein